MTYSPAERRFADAMEQIGGQWAREMRPQLEVRGFRLDFAIPSVWLGIEIDGAAYHTRPIDRFRDQRRQGFIESAGWKIIRFTGSEVYRDAHGCALQAMAYADHLARR